MNFSFRRVPLFVSLFFSASLLGLAVGCVEPFDVPDIGTPDGKAFVNRCSLCHALPDPSRMTYPKWEKVIERMAINIRAHNVPQWPPAEQVQILRYLKRHAKPVGETPENAP